MIPTAQTAIKLLDEASVKNPGRWVTHSQYVAEAARRIATRHPDLDSDYAWVFGCLHDIGRREGVNDLRHTLDGYHFLMELGYDTAARYCLTHSFVIKDLQTVSGRWDCSPEESAYAEAKVREFAYTDYDRLIQLCDAIAQSEGFCLMEKRLVDVALRRGCNEQTIRKWQALFEIKSAFENKIGCSIYQLLPGVAGNTFGRSTKIT